MMPANYIASSWSFSGDLTVTWIYLPYINYVKMGLFRVYSDIIANILQLILDFTIELFMYRP